MSTLSEVVLQLQGLVTSCLDAGETMPVSSDIAAYSELMLELFKLDTQAQRCSSFDVCNSLRLYKSKQQEHISRISECLAKETSSEPANFASFARNSSVILGELTWSSVCPTLKWLMYAVQFMNEFMLYEGGDGDGGSDTGGGEHFFRNISSDRRLATNSLTHVLWISSLADAWNAQDKPIFGKISIAIFASLDHVWFGYRQKQDEQCNWVPCELCCTATSSDLVLACIGKDPAMIFRNTFLAEDVSTSSAAGGGGGGDPALDYILGPAAGAPAEDPVCKKALSRSDFACYLLTQSAFSMKDRLVQLFTDDSTLPCPADSDADAASEALVPQFNTIFDSLLAIVGNIFTLSQRTDHCLDSENCFLVGCLMLAADKDKRTSSNAQHFRGRLWALYQSIHPPASQANHSATALSFFDRAVQFNSENYLARMYLLQAYLTIDPYLAYKHAAYLLDLISLYNENGLSAKCQSVYQPAFSTHQDLLAANQFNESAESEYLADIPEVGKCIIVTWDVEFEEDPSTTQPFEYDAMLCAQAEADEACDIVGADSLAATAFPKLYVNYLSTGEKYYIRFKSHEACDHLMEDGAWETFPYYLGDENASDSGAVDDGEDENEGEALTGTTENENNTTATENENNTTTTTTTATTTTTLEGTESNNHETNNDNNQKRSISQCEEGGAAIEGNNDSHSNKKAKSEI
jgi:hypothetical protein